MRGRNNEGIQSHPMGLNTEQHSCTLFSVFLSYFCIKSNQTVSLGALLCAYGLYSSWRVTVCVCVCVLSYLALANKHVLYIEIYTLYILHAIQCTLFIQPCPLCI